MRSIRSQLLLWLVPSFIIIAFLASSSLYFSEKLRLETNLDNELIKLVRAVKLTIKTPRNRFGSLLKPRLNIVEKTQLIVGNQSSKFYLQLWNENGDIISQSENLGEQQLSFSSLANQPNKQSDDGVSFDSKLASGELIRVHSFVLQEGPRSRTVKASVAISKMSMNQQLAKFSIKLLLGATFCCLLLSGILIFVIRRTLIPIQGLSEQLTKVEAGSLHNRFNAIDVPNEISPLVERLNQLLARLEQSFFRERQFNNDLAHELRTPLAAIRTTSEVALKWPEQSSIDDHQYIAESSAQLQNTIDSLLCLARIESSETNILIEDVDINAIIKECLVLQSSIIKERGITINLSANNHHIIKSAPHLLRIIISNLINNAVEYAPINSEVVITAQSNDSILSVANMAPCLSKADLTSMFDRLWRKDDARTGTKHVGLGLSIAHTAAQAISLELTAKLHDNHNNKPNNNQENRQILEMYLKHAKPTN